MNILISRQSIQHICLLLGFFFLLYPVYAQVGINQSNQDPDPSAMLDIQSSDKGLLIPRMDSTSRKAIANPATGLMVYDSTTQSFWYFDTVWTEIGEGDDFGDHKALTNIQLLGNWLSQDGDHEGLYVDSLGKIGIGTTSPLEQLEVEGAINIGHTDSTNTGSIRWNPATQDFEGYQGERWVSLTYGNEVLANPYQTDKFVNNLILPDDGDADDLFGKAVAISDNYAIIGAPQDEENGAFSGSAYIFVKIGDNWVQQAKLAANDAATLDQFGGSVSISGEYAIVGATGADHLVVDAGAAYVFKRTGNSWSQEAKLVGSDVSVYIHFGGSVSIFGEYAIIGAKEDDDNGTSSGSAYIFKRNGTNWEEQSKILADDGDNFDQFGIRVGISHEYAIVGARYEASNGNLAGAAYIFHRDDTTWNQQAKLLASDGGPDDNFGSAVAISGDLAIVGSPQNGPSSPDSGAAYIFVRNGSNWSQEAKLAANDGDIEDRFGSSVAISGALAIVGSPRDNDQGSVTGSAYIFGRTGNSWTQQGKLTAFDAAPFDAFGVSVGISGKTFLVGAASNDDNGFESGSAYVFDEKKPIFLASDSLHLPGVGTLDVSGLKDNLGNHMVTQNLQLGNYWLSGDGDGEGISIDSSGNVGIGISNPDTSFHLIGKFKYQDGSENNGFVLTADANGEASWQAPDGSDHLGNHTATQNLQLGSNWISGDGDNEGIFIDGNGYLGIGNNVPHHPIDFGTGLGRKLAIFQNANGTDFYGLGLHHYTLEFHAGNDTNDPPDMVVRSSGNVGIGTTIPDKTLHIVGNLKIQDGTQSHGFVLTTDAWGNASWQAPVGTSDNLGNHIANQNLSLGTHWLSGDGDGEGISIDSSGNVGIGTTAPNHTLEVQGGNIALHRNHLLQFLRNDGSPAAQIGSDWSGLSLYENRGGTTTQFKIATTGDAFEFLHNSESRLHINSAGNVGIGTDLPDALLHVDGAIHAGLSDQTILHSLTNESGTPTGDGFRLRNSINFFGANLDAVVFEKTDENNADPDGGFAFVNTGNDGAVNPAMVIKGNGNVGVGTSNPTYPLHVTGETKINGILRPGEIRFPGAASTDANFIGTAGNAISFGHVNSSEDFIGYKSNTFYFKDAPTGADTQDPNVIIGGKLGVGTASPSSTYSLDISGSGYFSDDLNVQDNLTVNNEIYVTSNMATAGLGGFDIAAHDVGGGKYQFRRQISSRRYKENIQPINLRAERILELDMKSWTDKNDSTGNIGLGFIAEEIDSVGLKEMVLYNEDGTVESLKFSYLPFYSLEIIKKQQTLIGELKDQLNIIETQTALWQDRNKQLEEKLQDQQRAITTLEAALSTTGLLEERLKALEAILDSHSSPVN